MAILENIFPPILDTYMPVFLNSDDAICRVYFSFSPYMARADINPFLTQVSVLEQNTNNSALNMDLYPSEIKVLTKTGYKVDDSRSGDDRFYIEIAASDLANGFKKNQYYKVQIRFATANCPVTTSSGAGIESWLVNNTQYFSEWSKVCLIRGIKAPELDLRYFQNDSSLTVFSSSVITILGTMLFEDGEQETLRSYNIKIVDTNNPNKTIYQSDEIYADNYNGVNEINYTIPKELQDNVNYEIILTTTTRNLYIAEYRYFFVIQYNINEPTINVNAIVEIDNGRIKLELLGESADVSNNIIIKRTSNKSNFELWEDIKVINSSDINPIAYMEKLKSTSPSVMGVSSITEQKTNVYLLSTWYDYSAESGIWYKYGIQYGNSGGYRSRITKMQYPIMINYDDMFLVSNDKQLKISFNQNISSLKYNVMENKADPIGSKYPFIQRNGDSFYRTLPLSGLISVQDDANEIFIKKSILQENAKKYYDELNTPIHIDHLLERLYREQVISFLYEDNVKLLKTTPEGNVLVRLMDISFTPENTLGRMIYSFKCTAYEIDECSMENYNKYGIQQLGTIENNIKSIDIGVTKAIEGSVENSDVDVLNVLTADARTKYTEYSNYTFSFEYFSYLKIIFLDDPFTIKDDNGVLTPGGKDYIGYILHINGEDILVDDLTQTYVLDGSAPFDIYNLTIPNNQRYQIIYKATGIYSPYNIDTTGGLIVNEYKIGQLEDKIFNINTELVTLINEQCSQNLDNLSTSCIAIKGIIINANEGTVIQLQWKNEESYSLILSENTQSLKIIEENKELMSLQFIKTIINKDNFISYTGAGAINYVKFNNGILTYYPQGDNNSDIFITNLTPLKIENGVYVEISNPTSINEIDAIEIYEPIQALVSYYYILEIINK